ncbi:MAG: hypothetical protein H6917_15305 [Novosphingobium sp.]|nr:hypothetical protein [Novosphingobium sp.]
MADIGIGWYNGWSPEERRATLPAQKAAIASGELARPTHCSICGCRSNRDWRAEDAVWLHDENYADPLAAYPVCRRCHRLLHRRFDDPQSWLELVTRHGGDGRTWFEQLTMDPDSRFRPFWETYPDGLPPS